MTIVVLEDVEADLVHHQRIIGTIPGARLGLFASAAAATKFYLDNKVDLVVVNNAISEGAIGWLTQVHVSSGRRDAPVIVICANGDKDARRAVYEYGVYNVMEKPIDPPSYLCITRNALSLQVMRRNDASATNGAIEQLRLLQKEIEEREVQTIYALLHAANLVDPALSRRMVRVAGMAFKIASRASTIASDDARRFAIAARIYDIGLLAVSPSLRERRIELGGPDAGKLLGPHVLRAADVFPKNRTGLLDLAATIARQHHERFDGRGYPDGLDKHDISIYAQLVAVAETFNDMTTIGPYAVGGGKSTPLSEKQALAYIDRQSGTAFDPEVVECLRLVVESPLTGEPVPANG